MSIDASGQTTRIDAKRLRELSTRRDGPAALRMAVHLGLVLALAAISIAVSETRGFFWAIPFIAMQGILMAFLFMPLHETVHRTAFRTEALNTVFGHLCGLAICFPWEYYRVFHWAHHRHTQDEAHDPELAVMPSAGSLWQRLLAFSGALQVYGRFRVLLRHALTGTSTLPWVPTDKRALIVREARLYLAAYAGLAAASLLFRSPLILTVWLGPLLIGQFALRPYLYTEHTGCGRSRSAFENTRTTYTNAVIRWFAWNMPYHAEHHAYPSVPFHALPAANALVAAGLRHTEAGYPRSMKAAWRALRLQT
ncbi:fatty acid desaturase [Reyranella sp.]|jgi:fatty acid desaturase|uniref:fatty acid desaturase n=1 Tax=Reyranella sp. TaxID=1929291 RepID=UPI000BCD13CB|nr:fatty acid desaturase [Reyranella sp.]OYY34633.1 MAG: fatty acid desaturase [Rhodospirillales bacterium 35-66-84]OYZ91062.1 MAG: fatty acid desaturase [Rhodospirillales bacterium 24-66-33]OZB21554.1 MAG: fatty acid desaturase [Rhodospirillales bacterium 39-66-50]HQS19118.1 fatty acid desaturase [Reyranella sp.]HQT15318.1 fatty acid desaturase [Reyranella sp.]